MNESEQPCDEPRRRARASAAPTGYLHLPHPSPSSAVLDRRALLARVGDDANLLRELIVIFLEECPGWLEEIKESVRRGDAKGLKLAAHRLSGTAATLGAAQVSDTAKRLERMGQSGSFANAEETCEELAIAADELTHALVDLSQNPAA